MFNKSPSSSSRKHSRTQLSSLKKDRQTETEKKKDFSGLLQSRFGFSQRFTRQEDGRNKPTFISHSSTVLVCWVGLRPALFRCVFCGFVICEEEKRV
uniref:Uncharacterized protein n=1 Tax=Nelumbo nucifera TaxID=4432 RepID=A0A822ZS88_NELNU|nr:TPA_asm: hypothetical protein HUJ06_018049 [Nelumbo nucifera]